MTVTAKDLTKAKARLREQGVKGALEGHQDRWCWRGYISVNGAARKQQRVPLGLPAINTNLFLAEERVRMIWGRFQSDGTIQRPLPWEIQALEETSNVLTVAQATDAYVEWYWKRKDETLQTHHTTLKRYLNELRRLPQDEPYSIELCIKTVEEMKKKSRARKEAVQTFARVAKIIGFPETEHSRISMLQQPVKRKEEKNPPTQEKLLEMLQTLRWARSSRGGERYDGIEWKAWFCCAIAIYGCRPSEAFGLTLKGNGATALCWTIKRHDGEIMERTAMALHPQWIKDYEMMDIPELPQRIEGRESYDPERCKYYVSQARRWFQKFYPEHDLYDLRHAWAIDSIDVLKGNTRLAALCMGHAHQVHEREYHKWIKNSQVQAMAQKLIEEYNNEQG